MFYFKVNVRNTSKLKYYQIHSPVLRTRLCIHPARCPATSCPVSSCSASSCLSIPSYTSALSRIRPVLHPSCPESVLSCILLFCIILSLYILSYIRPFLHQLCPACILFCIHPVLPSSCGPHYLPPVVAPLLAAMINR